MQSSGEFSRENEKLCLFNSHRRRPGEGRDPNPRIYLRHLVADDHRKYNGLGL